MGSAGILIGTSKLSASKHAENSMKVYSVSITFWVSFEWRRNTLKGLQVTDPQDASGMSRKDSRDAKGAQRAR